jgi:hypothetical protein
VANAWATQVVANGGAAPSQITKNVMATFWCGLISAGLDSAMIAVNLYSPGGLIEAQTPLYFTAGNALWSAIGVAPAPEDITVAGLRLIGDSTHLDTGINISTALASDNNAGVSMYGLSDSSSAGVVQGAANFAAYEGFGVAGTQGMIYFTSTLVMPAFSNAPNVYVYQSLNRTAINNCYALRMNGATGPVTSSGTDLTFTHRPNGNFQISKLGTLGNPSQNWHTFTSVHTALSNAQEQTLFGLVQAARTSFGGGYT